jgi:hypothetical protein
MRRRRRDSLRGWWRMNWRRRRRVYHSRGR